MKCHLMVIAMWFPVVYSSAGDRSFAFQKCNNRCMKNNCTKSRVKLFSDQQPMSHKLLRWSCGDECNYNCMWSTVDAFERDGLSVPQFFGKWPFIRVLGMQEPASVVFSALNLLVQLSILKYRRLIPSSTPLYYVTHLTAAVAVNAWLWSMVFHAKDTPLTEKLDYFCAFSIVLTNAIHMVSRILGTQKWWRPLLFTLVCVVFYIKHITYLARDRFDYGYNMQVNVSVGICNLLGWLTWCVLRWRYQPYVWKCVFTIVGIQLCLCLELFDFPPILWTFDAHSLWHAGTPALVLVYYSFLIDDAHYMMKKQNFLPEKLD